MKMLSRLAGALAGLFIATAGAAASINHDTVVAPIGAGPFKVACSNIEQDPARIAALGSTPAEIWEGRPRDGQPRYITQVLSAPQAALVFEAPVPDLREIYPRYAGGSVTHVAIVCHPTPASNNDPDYRLPGPGDLVPRMQAPGAVPKLIGLAEYAEASGIFLSPVPPNVPARLPLLVFSHGLGGSPISGGYIDAMVDLASQGFMVGAVFHGDPRFSRVRIEDLNDFLYLLTDFDEFVEMELLRPVSLKAMTDVLLAHPQFAAAIHPDRIGAFGASLGGQSVANLLGARLTASVRLACRETVRDPRIKAAVGLVPYAGQTFMPAFCNDQSGAADVNRPYLAISGTADTTSPIKMMEQALNRFGASRYLVQLDGVKHEYVPGMRDDVMTWAVTFLRAYLGSEDPGAGATGTPMARLIRMQGAAGGPADSLRVDVHITNSAPATGLVAIEYYNEPLAHYFITAEPGEAAIIDAGGAGPGWMRTGQAFGVSRLPPGNAPLAVPVCRFYGRPAGGPNSHFFTADAGECAFVRTTGGWFYEGVWFHAVAVDANGACPSGMLKVLRAYNKGFPRNDSNHRFTTSDSTWQEMARLGWAQEGAAMCASP